MIAGLRRGHSIRGWRLGFGVQNIKAAGVFAVCCVPLLRDVLQALSRPPQVLDLALYLCVIDAPKTRQK